jgi:putative glutamine amidotransferase
MTKPLIGLTCGAIKRDTGELYHGVLVAYTKSIVQAGGIPLLIPPTMDETLLRATYEHVDGVLMTGGGDVDPVLYGMTDDGLVHNVQPERDATEINVAKWAAAEDKPLFGICRGSQVMNVALGGTLYRDIPAEYPHHNDVEHDLWGSKPRDFEAHSVEVKDGTHLARVLNTHSVMVNTLHHQSVKDIAPGLHPSAAAPDGIIEGVELPNARFYVGVQWHPEEMTGYSEPMRRLFAAFVEAAKASQR